jgi:hypothetical protein
MKRKVFVAGLVILGLMASSGAVEIWVCHEIQARLHIKIEGKYDPMFFRPAFRIRDARFTWRQKVELLSGDLNVRYDLLKLVSSNQIRVRLSGRDLKVKLLGSWSKIQGIENAVIRNLDTGIAIGPGGLEKIDYLELDSDEFQFRIHESLK